MRRPDDLLRRRIVKQRTVIHHGGEIGFQQCEELLRGLRAASRCDTEQPALSPEIRDGRGVLRRNGFLRRQQRAVQIGQQCKAGIGLFRMVHRSVYSFMIPGFLPRGVSVFRYLPA